MVEPENSGRYDLKDSGSASLQNVISNHSIHFTYSHNLLCLKAIFHKGRFDRKSLWITFQSSQTKVLPYAVEMPDIIPRFDYPTGCAVKCAMRDNTQAGIVGRETAWAVQWQACNVAKDAIQNPTVDDQGNAGAGSMV